MPHEVRGVIAAAKGDKVKVGRVLVPDPAQAKPLCGCKRAACVTPTFIIEKAR